VPNKGAPTGSRCPKLTEMRVPLANLGSAINGGDGEAVMEAGDDGPLAGVSIDLYGHRDLFALATRKVLDELALAPGDRVFALVKSWRSMNARSRWRTRDPLETCPPGSLTL
jgi:molybdopterin-binding protein